MKTDVVQEVDRGWGLGLSPIIRDLLHEIDQVDPLGEFAPTREVGLGEVVLGTLADPFTRRLYCLARRYERNAKLEEINMDSNPNNQNIRSHVRELNTKLSALNRLFGFCVRTELNQFQNVRTLAMRKGWAVVDLNVLSTIQESCEAL